MELKFYPKKDCTKKRNVNGYIYSEEAYKQLKEKINEQIKNKKCMVVLPNHTNSLNVELKDIYAFVESIDYEKSIIKIKPIESNKHFNTNEYAVDTIKIATTEKNNIINKVLGFVCFRLSPTEGFKNGLLNH